MKGGPEVKKWLFAIQFLGICAIVRVVSNHSGSIKMETSVYGPVHHGYIKITWKGMDVEVLVKITDRGY